MSAANKPLTWTARIVRCTVHDGDTLTNVVLDVGWGVHLSRSGTAPLSVRITSSAGPINAPEVTGREAEAGWFVRDWLSVAVLGKAQLPWLVSRSLDRDAYGRCIGEIHSGEGEVGLLMLERGLVKRGGPGGKRVPFTDEELAGILAMVGAKP